MIYKEILVGTDGSETAGKAVELAAGMAAALQTKLVIVHAGYRVGILEEAARAVSEFGAHVDIESRGGEPADVILEIAREREVELIVMGDRGQSKAKRVLLGGVPDRVTRNASCDVLITRTTSARAFDGYERLLLATDGSPTADRAARRGIHIARVLQLKLTVVHVGHPKTGEAILRDTVDNIGGGIEADLLALEGDPAGRILEAIEEAKPDLVVVGNRGMAGAKGALLGSIPQAIAQRAPCDVLIVHSTMIAPRELGKGEAGLVVHEGRVLAAYRDTDGLLHAVAARCTHLGCTVGFNARERTWDCPCHGSRYTLDGSVLHGPAKDPLEPVQL